jgi:hypothetical protein
MVKGAVNAPCNVPVNVNVAVSLITQSPVGIG